MIRDFTIGEFWYLLQATRWTIALAAVAFVGGEHRRIRHRARADRQVARR